MLNFSDLVFKERTNPSAPFFTPRAEMNFPNGYGVSVFSEPNDQSFYELAVLKGDKLYYDSPVTDDVLRWQTSSEISEAMETIQKLEEAQ